jgi:hypothetical protein
MCRKSQNELEELLQTPRSGSKRLQLAIRYVLVSRYTRVGLLFLHYRGEHRGSDHVRVRQYVWLLSQYIRVHFGFPRWFPVSLSTLARDSTRRFVSSLSAAAAKSTFELSCVCVSDSCGFRLGFGDELGEESRMWGRTRLWRRPRSSSTI